MWLAKSVIPECNIDSCLFNVLLNFEKDGVNHTKGNSTVVKKTRGKFENMFCLAIIDQDKRDIDFISAECEKIQLDHSEEYFKIHKHKTKPHYFIQIVPVIEKWIIKVAQELGIKLIDFNIDANTFEELVKITKKVSSKNDEKFRKLFKEFVKEAKALNFKPILRIAKISNYIVQNPYNVDINELKNA